VNGPRAPQSPARRIALEALLRAHGGGFLRDALDHALEREALSAPDRGLATALAYGVARLAGRLDVALARRLQRPDDLPPEARWILRAAAWELFERRTPPHAVVSQWTGLARRFAPRHAALVSAVSRRLELPADLRPHEQHSIPEWWWSELAAEYGDRAGDAMAGLNEAGRVAVRVRAGGEGALRAENAHLEPSPVAGVYWIDAGEGLRNLAAIRLGLAVPMNPASALVSLAAAPSVGERVIDLCGGRGSKALALADMGARVVSLDVNPAAVAAAAELHALGGVRVERLIADATTANLEPAPLVLLDAPCTGSGTIRTRPEIRWRTTPESLARATNLQHRLLLRAIELVAPGGSLVYAVCSLFPSEGRQQIERVLADRDDVAPDTVPEVLPSIASGAGWWSTLPREGVDGFFIAKLRRR
jgi:16S rRNA (cytosine967-C5)-methyltransferase